jgi:uncharacterized membrane protein
MTTESPVPATESRRAIWRRLFATIEGKILGAGIGLAAVGLILMGIVALWSPQLSSMIGGMVFTNIVFGRAVAMSIGYASGYGHAVVIAANMMTETILVLLFYPLFVFSLNKLVVFRSIQGFLDRTHRAANQHREKVRRYGVIGVFTFVWFPFWMTGPVVGCAIGYLIGLSAVVNLVAVLSGTFVAMAVWAYVLYGLQAKAATLGPWAPALLIGFIVAVVLAGYWLNRRRNHNNTAAKPDAVTPAKDGD